MGLRGRLMGSHDHSNLDRVGRDPGISKHVVQEDMCLVGWLYAVYRSTREFFTHIYGDVTIVGEGLQILTYARHFGH